MKRIALIAMLFSCALLTQSVGQPQDDGSAAPSAMRRHGTAGTITAIADGKFTLKTIDGKTATIILGKDTQFHVDRQAAKQSDFKVGDAVLVRGDPSGENQWQAELVAKRSNNAGEAEFREAMGKRFIAGEIKAINGLQLTILRPDGVTQTIAVDENTSFRKQGESVTLADFKAGDHVFGRGEVKNGTFVPTVLAWGDPMAMFNGQGADSKSPGK